MLYTSIFGDTIEYTEILFSKILQDYEEDIKPSGKFGTPISLAIVFNQELLEEFKKDFLRILDFCGYFILENSDCRYVVEPKKPMVVDLISRKLKHLYHVTLRDKIEKIKKIGLVPKDSQTTFNHPSDRIYLFYTKTENLIKTWKSILADNKGINEEKMAVLKVEPNPKKVYYLDYSATLGQNVFAKDGILAIFTNSNIPPSEIEFDYL